MSTVAKNNAIDIRTINKKIIYSSRLTAHGVSLISLYALSNMPPISEIITLIKQLSLPSMTLATLAIIALYAVVYFTVRFTYAYGLTWKVRGIVEPGMTLKKRPNRSDVEEMLIMIAFYELITISSVLFSSNISSVILVYASILLSQGISAIADVDILTIKL